MNIPNALCRVDDLVMIIHSRPNSKAIDAYLYKVGHKTPVLLQLWVSNMGTNISVQNLFGNGDDSELCNQGYGSLLVTCAFDYIKSALYNDEKIESISVNGIMRDLDSIDPETSHLRRAHFWRKIGFNVRSNDDTLDGSFEAALSDVAEPTVLMNWVLQEPLTIAQIERKDWQDSLVWSRSDYLLVSKLNNFDLDTLIECGKLLDDNNHASGMAFRRRQKAFQVIGAFCATAIYALFGGTSFVNAIFMALVGLMIGTYVSVVYPLDSKDISVIENKYKALRRELDELLLELDRYWCFFSRLNTKSGGQLNEFISSEGLLNLDGYSELSRIETFLKKTKQC